ncbi:MAG: response regulator, partial [Bacteroidota bacterium]
GNLRFKKRLVEEVSTDKFITDFEKDANHRVWVGSSSRIHLLDTNATALGVFKLPSKVATEVKKITKIHLDNKDRIWLVTAAHGVFMANNISKVNPDDEIKFEHFVHEPDDEQGLTSNIILSITEAQNNIIWCGTGNGIVYFDEAARSFRPLKINGKIFDKKVMSIASDKDNNLWITTIFSGLYFYDRTADTFINYTQKDGLISNAFLFSSSYYDQLNNKIYFGSDEGLQQINLDFIERYPPKKQPWVSTIASYQKNKPQFVPVTWPSELEIFELEYENRNVTLNFSSIDFHQTDKIRYAYSLNGEAWTELPERTGHFTNLPIGENIISYTSYYIGEEPQPITEASQIVFEVHPPYYRSTIAYIIYCLMGAIILVVIFRLLLKNRMAKEKMHNAQLLDTAKSTMYANISHEFKTPLTIINGLSSRLLKRPTFPKTEQETITSIRQSGEQLSTLVNQMLELASLDNNVLRIHEKKGDIIAFVKKCVMLFKPFAVSKEQKLIFHTSVDSLEMDIDDDKLQKIINNLISNAIKFTPKGGEIIVSIKQLNMETITVEITDTGKGIEQKHLPHIFDRYYKTFDRDNNLGSGIGMALTKGLVEFLGGTIAVDSSIGKGTRFTVELPVKKTKKDKEPLEFQQPFLKIQTEEITLKENKSNQNATILVVEDHVDIRNFLKEILASKYHIMEAANGKKALQISERKTVDFIVSDVMMPQMDGFEFCEKIKMNPKTSHIPFIMVTARTDNASRLKGYKLGIDAYINKPFNEEELLQIIDNILEKKEAQTQYFKRILDLKSGTSEIERANSVDIDFISRIQSFALDKTQKASVENLLKEIPMSRTQLHRKVKQLTGMSITAYLNHIKVEKAKNLLSHTELTVSEIAFELGYEDPKYFSRLFKKRTSKSPSSYKESAK